MKATIVKLISKDLSLGQTIKDVKIISADFSNGQLKVLFDIVLEEVCIGGCVDELTNSTLATSINIIITNALEIGEFVQTMQNVTEDLIANNPSLVNDTILSEVKSLNATGAEGNITTSVVITTQAPTTVPTSSLSSKPTLTPTDIKAPSTTGPSANPIQSPTASPTLSPTTASPTADQQQAQLNLPLQAQLNLPQQPVQLLPQQQAGLNHPLQAQLNLPQQSVQLLSSVTIPTQLILQPNDKGRPTLDKIRWERVCEEDHIDEELYNKHRLSL